MKKQELKKLIKECLNEVDMRAPKGMSYNINNPPLPEGWTIKEGQTVVFDEKGQPRAWSNNKGMAVHLGLRAAGIAK